MKIHKISIVGIFLVSIMMMGILLCCTSQVQAAQEGDFTYTVTDGKAEITGYTGIGGDVTIPSTLGEFPITSIINGAFQYNENLKLISIPQGVTSIGDVPFLGCTGLTTITVSPDNTNYASIDGVLYNKAGTILIKCPSSSSLNSISIPQGVTSICDQAFADCSGLTTVIISQEVTSIGNGAFWRCTGLTNINIPQGVTDISGNVFYGCKGLTSISIPQGVTSIGDYAFEGCTSLTSISIPESLKSIGNQAFRDCNSLEIINMPQGVTTIGGYAFSGCWGLTSINIPQGVTTIRNGVFDRCIGLTSINIPQGVTTIEAYAFNDCTSLTSINIPEGVKTIPYEAFSYCTGLTSINIPQGVTNIDNCAFYECKGLTSITFNSASTLIYDSQGTIPETATIIGYALSTAKDYATKYNRAFEVISNTNVLTPVVSNVQISPTSGYAGDNFTITANVTNNPSSVFLQFKNPGGGWISEEECQGKFTLTKTSSNTDGSATYSITMPVIESGIEAEQYQRYFRVIAIDNAGNLNSDSTKEYSFVVKSKALSPLDNWHLRKTLPQGNTLNGITYGNNTYVTVGDFSKDFKSTGLTLTSLDGIAWANQASNAADAIFGVAYAKNTFVAVGHNGLILTSQDGLTWTSRSSGTENSLIGITYSNNTFVAVGYSTILTSPDGITWTKRLSDTEDLLNCVTYGKNTFVAVGYDLENSGFIYASPDGVTWTKQNLDTSRLSGITYGNDTFVTVGDGTILTSKDGITWTNITTDMDTWLEAVTYSNNTFLAVGDSGKILTSPDGKTWTRRTSGTIEFLHGVIYNNNTFVVVGDEGTILQSDPLTQSHLTITTSNLPSGTVGSPYNATLSTSGGSSPYTWSATGLPKGLNLSSNTGIISGVPTVGGTATVKIIVTDSSGQSASVSLSLTINNRLSAPTISSTDPAQDTTGIALDKKIIISFCEDVKPGDAYQSIVVSNLAINKNLDGNTLTLSHPDNMKPNTKYTVTIPKGAVKDSAGNILASEYSFSFTTKNSVKGTISISAPICFNLGSQTIKVTATDNTLNHIYVTVKDEENKIVYQQSKEGNVFEDSVNFLSAGNFTINATGSTTEDNTDGGNLIYATPVTVSAGGTVSVNISSPKEGDIYTAGKVKITANGTNCNHIYISSKDPNGIDVVDKSLDGNYFEGTFYFNTPGKYKINATACDRPESSTSKSKLFAYNTKNITIIPAPSVKITTPTDTNINLGDTIHFKAQVKNCDHFSVSMNGEYIVGSQKCNSDNYIYNYDCTPKTAGEYKLTITGRNTENESDPGSTVSSDTIKLIVYQPSQPLDAPQGLIANSITSDSVELQWNPVMNADAYNIHRTNCVSGLKKVFKNIRNTQYLDYTVQPGTSYFYCVVGVSSNGNEGKWPQSITVTTKSASTSGNGDNDKPQQDILETVRSLGNAIDDKHLKKAIIYKIQSIQQIKEAIQKKLWTPSKGLSDFVEESEKTISKLETLHTVLKTTDQAATGLFFAFDILDYEKKCINGEVDLNDYGKLVASGGGTIATFLDDAFSYPLAIGIATYNTINVWIKVWDAEIDLNRVYHDILFDREQSFVNDYKLISKHGFNEGLKGEKIDVDAYINNYVNYRKNYVNDLTNLKISVQKEPWIDQKSDFIKSIDDFIQVLEDKSQSIRNRQRELYEENYQKGLSVFNLLNRSKILNQMAESELKLAVNKK